MWGFFRGGQAVILLLLLLGFSLAAAAAEVPVPDLKARVTDLAAVIDLSTEAALEEKLRAFENEKGSQIAVLTLPTTQPESVEQYSLRVAEKWRLGRKGVDDGILLLVAVADRHLRIEVGYGLEGAVPDALAKRIIDEIMTPKLKAGDYAGAIDGGVNALIGLVQGEPLPEPSFNSSTNGENPLVAVLLLALVVFLVLLIQWKAAGRGSGGSGGGSNNSGGSGGSRGGGGGFSGGGGRFGGGGSSGRW
jgi:uncharacterized protein